MRTETIPAIAEQRRLASPTVTPQALAWHNGSFWMGSRDLRRIYEIDPESWSVKREMDAPGIPWAAVSTGEELRFTIGEGEEDDRYIWRFAPDSGFLAEDRIACPDFTGSYLSFDGEHLYLSQWYKHRILKLDQRGETLRTIEVGADICGHTFVDGILYVLRGSEADNERWAIARLDQREDQPVVTDVARIPFASRSLAHDGQSFWSNHRAGNETLAFILP